MRCILPVLLMILHSGSALAQEYAEQTYPSQPYPPQQVSGNYYPNAPVVAPQQYAPTDMQSPPSAHNQPHPGEYGVSVMTDIRQMNF